MKQFSIFSLLILFLSSCGLFGIHFKVHNPRIASRYPRFSEEVLSLAKNTSLRKNFDVTFYNLDITISPDSRTLSGWVEIKSLALNNIDSIQLDLDQPLTIDELHWQTREGESLVYSRNYRSVYVKLPNRIAKGTLFSVHIKYHGKPIVAAKPPWEGGLVWKKDKQKNDWVGVACEIEGASIWFPCKDQTSDEPDSTHMCFTIPDTFLFVVSNGVFLGSERKGNTQSFNWKIGYPVNLYDITFYVGNFVKVEDIYKGISGKELQLNYYVLKPNAEKAAKHFQQVKKHLKAYEELYGEYSWYNDGFKLVESPYAGMEHQTAIAYGNGYKNDLYGKDDYILLHETGHEWFGNAITAADLADVWLQEGITTYGEYLYLEKEYDADVAFSHLYLYRMMIKNKRPVVGPYERRYFNYRDGDVYVKAAWVLHTLRNNINNDSSFFSVLRTFYNENKLKTTNSTAFIETVNRVTGKDYKWFFNQYLYHNKVPFLEFEFCADGTIYYRWVDVAEGFNKLNVSLKFDTNEKTYEIFPDTWIKKFKLPEDMNIPSSLFIDDHKALFGIKKNKKLQQLYEEQEEGKQQPAD